MWEISPGEGECLRERVPGDGVHVSPSFFVLCARVPLLKPSGIFPVHLVLTLLISHSVTLFISSRGPTSSGLRGLRVCKRAMSAAAYSGRAVVSRDASE